jgi:hypothetical protein
LKIKYIIVITGYIVITEYIIIAEDMVIVQYVVIICVADRNRGRSQCTPPTFRLRSLDVVISPVIDVYHGIRRLSS